MGSDGERGTPTLQEAMNATAGATGVTSCGRTPLSTPSLMRGGRVLRAAYSERDMRVADLICDVAESTARPHSPLAGSTSNRGSESCLSEASPETAERGLQHKATRRGLSSSLSFPRGVDEAIGSGDPCWRTAHAAKHGRGCSEPSAIGRPAASQRLPTAAVVQQPGSDFAADEARAAAATAAQLAAGSTEPTRLALSTLDVSISGGSSNGGGSCVGRTGGTGQSSSTVTSDGGRALTIAASASAPPGTMTTNEAGAVMVATAVSEAAAVDQDRGRWSRLTPSYKQRSDELKKLFKGLPEEDRLLVDYSCALQKDFLVHGRLYLSQNWICFYSNLFGWESTISIPLREITAINKCRTAMVIPNAIQITTAKDRFLFSSFVSRDQTYLVIFRAWICALSERPITGSDLWALVRWLYGSPQEAEHSGDEHQIATEAAEELLPSENGADGSHLECESLERSQNACMRNRTIDDVEPVASALNGTTLGHSSSSSSSRNGRSSSSSCSASDEPGTDEDRDAVDPQDVSVGPAMEGCPTKNHEHRGIQMLDSTFDLPAHELFSLLFTDSPFFANFLAKRATSDLVLSSWPQSPDADGKKQRTLTYTLAINASFGPKRSPATEVQIALPETVPGRFYAVDCEHLNAPTLPYGENFYVLNKYCVRRLSSISSRLLVHSDIVYVKPVYSIVKGIIQRNVAAGVKDYLRQLNETLLAEARVRDLHAPAVVAGPSGAAGEPNRSTTSSCSATATALDTRPELSQGDTADKRSRSQSSTYHQPGLESPEAGSQLGETAKSPAAASARMDKSEHRHVSSAQHGLRKRLLLNAALCLLLAANLLMFCHTWWLDTASLELGGARRDSVGSVPDEVVRTTLEQHQRGHDKEAEHWRELFESSTDMIYRLQHDIEELRNLVASRRNQSEVSG